MDSSTTLIPGNDWPSQTPLFSKIGSYFDRPGWWEEGAETLKAFFDDDTSSVDTTDQQLEDLLDLLEPLKVDEEPNDSSLVEETSMDPANDTADLSTLQQEQNLHSIRDNDQSFESSNDPQLHTNIENTSNDLLSTAKAVDIHLEEGDTVAPAIADKSTGSLSLLQHCISVRPLLTLDTNTSSGVIDTSSPVFTGTTTSTRQTSLQPEPSTRASSAAPDTAASPSLSPDDGTTAHPTVGAPMLSYSSRKATASHTDKPTPLTTEGALNHSLTALNPIEDHAAALPVARIQDRAPGEVATQGLSAASEQDPTGLQAVKDEISDGHGLRDQIDSSILSEEDDATVVHDPYSAAVSFFPPNPYSDEPVDYPTQAAHHLSSVFDAQHGVDYHQDTEDSSTDSTLTSLASNDDHIQTILLDQLTDYETYIAATPSPPPTSPLSPPPSFLGTRYADPDILGAADSGEEDTTALSIASTPSKPITKLGKVTVKNHDDGSESRDTGSLEITDGVNDELSEDTDADGTEVLKNLLDLDKKKRKQQYPHEDERAQKRHLSSGRGDERRSGTDVEAVASPEEPSTKGRTRRTTQKGKVKATSRPSKHNSTDERASESADELANPPNPNPLWLNKKGGISSAYSKVNRSTSSRSRARKPVDTPAPLPKLGGVSRLTRSGAVPASAPSIAVPSTEVVVDELADASKTDTQPPAKRNRLPGANPLSAQELKSLGATPILERRTRAGTATAESTPEPGVQGADNPAPKRTKFGLSTAEVKRLGSFVMTESRTRHSTVEPTPDPTPEITPAKSNRKATTKRVGRTAAKPAAKPTTRPVVFGSLTLASRSNGAPAATRKRTAPKKKTTTKAEQDDESSPAVEPMTQRKRKKEAGESEEQPTRASKRIAGAETEGE